MRREEALRYLTTTDFSISRTAALLGPSEASVLSRAARRWWGRTPDQVRRDGPDR